MKRAFALLPLAAVLLAGCGSGSSDTSTTTGSTTTTGTGSSTTGSSTSAKTPDSGYPKPADPTAGTTGSAAATDPSASTPTPPPVASNTPVPADLKNAAYDWEGLANTKPLDMEVKIAGPSPQDLTGSQTFTLTDVKDGVATYTVTRTGGLESLGTDTYTLKKDGVYQVKSSKMSLAEAALDLPADPKPGKTWDVKVKGSDPTQKMDLSMTTTIIGTESVSTAAGTFKDALVVKQTGSGTQQGENVRTTGKQWYVKGLGVVKSELTMTRPKNQVIKFSIEVTHR